MQLYALAHNGGIATLEAETVRPQRVAAREGCNGHPDNPT